MKTFRRIVTAHWPLSIALVLFCGCRGIQSEVQKAKITAASPLKTIEGTELRLASSLKRTFHSDGQRFDLRGQLVVSAGNGSLPTGVEAYHLALKPGWRGWPGYYVMNFRQRNGIWHSVTGSDSTFTGTSKVDADKIVIEFVWRDLGGGLSKKPEHFATYDVSVSLSDTKAKQHILTNLNVPTD